MSHLRNADYASQVEASRERLLARVEPVAELLPGIVAKRDAKASEAVLARRTKIELQALVVILASWLAEAEEREAAKGSEAA
jgi:hypothetical protein